MRRTTLCSHGLRFFKLALCDGVSNPRIGHSFLDLPSKEPGKTFILSCIISSNPIAAKLQTILRMPRYNSAAWQHLFFFSQFQNVVFNRHHPLVFCYCFVFCMQGNFDLFRDFAVHLCAVVYDDCTLWCSG